MINTYIPYISKSERKLLNSCLNSTFISTAGPRIEQFENLFIKIFKFKYAVAVNSGTSAPDPTGVGGGADAQPTSRVYDKFVQIV